MDVTDLEAVREVYDSKRWLAAGRLIRGLGPSARARLTDADAAWLRTAERDAAAAHEVFVALKVDDDAARAAAGWRLSVESDGITVLYRDEVAAAAAAEASPLPSSPETETAAAASEVEAAAAAPTAAPAAAPTNDVKPVTVAVALDLPAGALTVAPLMCDDLSSRPAA